MPNLAPRQLIFTVYGLYAREERNWLSVSSAVRLLADVGIDAASVRSSISRLKRRGVLESCKVGRAAGYSLSQQALEMLREGDVRIFSQRRAEVSDGLMLVVFSIPESERDRRHSFRTALLQMGCGTVASGVLVAPPGLRPDLRRAIQRMGLEQNADLFHSRCESFVELKQRVAEWWDLAAIEAEYREFVAAYQDVPARLKEAEDPVRAAFESYVPMLTTWRRLPYRDPGLPLELLPDGWVGEQAADLFTDLNALLRSRAHEHALRVIHG
ncbi:PaaX family transcriptional regulator [Streptomyces odontomachi]|uniref:PaaX family transcriptional regulator n=1 Tax=Streptomyces odontomachi TaxID=2944940 RepID=UPI00210A19C5|nr:PaaX family transcriptional regulator C-terminal domain-containing protein [Streptomyces sp. ODS25]